MEGPGFSCEPPENSDNVVDDVGPVVLVVVAAAGMSDVESASEDWASVAIRERTEARAPTSMKSNRLYVAHLG